MSGRFRSFLLLAVAAVVPVACSGSDVNRGDVNVFGLEAEWQLGDELAAEVSQVVEVVDDPVVTAFVDGIGQDLAQQTELADREWEFHVVQDPTLNAFALPGGHVFVHSGLLRAVRSEAELAGVLAHEVSHIEARHSTEALTRAYGVDLLARVIGDGEGQLEQMAEDVAIGSTVATFSRGAEREADQLGLTRLAEAGYDPEGMAGFFELLLDQQERRPTVVEQFFATHPLTEDRLDRARRRAAALQPVPPLEEGDDEELAEVQRRLVEMS